MLPMTAGRCPGLGKPLGFQSVVACNSSVCSVDPCPSWIRNSSVSSVDKNLEISV